MSDVGQIVNQIREIYPLRQDLLRAEGDHSRRIKSIWRRYGINNGPQSTPEEKRLFKLADWLADMVAWEHAMNEALVREQPFRKRPPKRPVVAGGGDQRLGDTPGEPVSPIDHGSGEDNQSVGIIGDVVLPMSRATLLAAQHDVPYVVATAILGTYTFIINRWTVTQAKVPYEKELEDLAQQLPVWDWVADVRGVGPLALAQIVGEAGNLSAYPNPAKLWKRMGLAVMADGERQRKVADKELAPIYGYSPKRRSVMFVIGDGLVKQNQDGPYRTYYLAEKQRQAELHPDARPIVIDRKAHRHMEKRFLKHLWQAWRRADGLAWEPEEWPKAA